MTAVNYMLRDLEDFRRHWVWFLFLGVVLILIGVAAMAAPWVATLTTMLFFGWLLLFSGALQIIHAFWARRWGGFFVQLLVGTLELVVGGLIVDNPAPAAAALTLLMAVFFVVGGIFRMFAALAYPFDGRGWLFVGGLVNLILGMMIWKSWPESSLKIIGLFVGIDLLIHGWWLVMLSVSVKSMPTGSAAGTT